MPQLSIKRNSALKYLPFTLFWLALSVVLSFAFWQVGAKGLTSQKADEQNTAEPLSLATADFDEDGVPDLVCGYRSSHNSTLLLYRGNVDSIYPNTREARRRREAAGGNLPAPFLSSTNALDLQVVPNFIGAGDFNADGHSDLVVAARGDEAIYLFAGDGHGEFGEARKIMLEGRVTALTTGEINRADGLEDVVVAVDGGSGAKVLVFEGPDGALRAQPEIFALPDTASALALDRLTNDHLFDLVVAAGHQLVVIEGRDKRLSPDEAHTTVPGAKTSYREFPPVLKSLAIGNFTNELNKQVALLSENGETLVLTYRRDNSGVEWQSESFSGGAKQHAVFLLSTRFTGGKFDDLVIMDGNSNQLQLITKESVVIRDQKSKEPSTIASTLAVDGLPVAALPMRLHVDARKDLVILRRGQVAPIVLSPMVAATFTVVSTADFSDSNLADGVCSTGSATAQGPCTLRAAIEQANATPGLDTINFNIPVSGTPTIILSPNSIQLPVISSPVIIDGTTQPSGRVELRGLGSGQGINGLDITGGDTTVRGLVINNFNGNGIRIASSNNIVEGSYIGTSAAGTTALRNLNNGIFIDGRSNGQIALTSNNNRIGGTVAAARNLISANFDAGVRIDASFLTPIGTVFPQDSIGSVATGNLVQGNYIGSDVNGLGGAGPANLGNLEQGVNIVNASGNTVGGTAAGAGNLIIYNGIVGEGSIAGVEISSIGGQSASNNLVQGNFIGTNSALATNLGNFGDGVLLRTSANNTIGGAVANAANVIARNRGNGVTIINTGTLVTALGNSILTNSIFSNSLGIDLGNNGVTPNDPGDADTGPNNLQNFPELFTALSRISNTVVSGRLDSTPNGTFRIEFFSNSACDSSGFGEGETFLGSTNVTTNVFGSVDFTFTTPATVPAGRFITATATDANGNTSEFSRCIPVREAVVDLSVTKTDSPDPVNAGSRLTYTIVVQNNIEADTATGVVVTDQLPAGVTFDSVFISQGTCAAPPVGGTGTVICSVDNVAANQTRTITIIVTPSPTTSGTITNTATVTSAERDRNPSNNSASASTTVIGLVDLAVDKSSAPNPVLVNNLLTYTVTVTNNGPGVSTGVRVIDTLPANVTLSSAGPTQGSCGREGSTINCNLGTLQPQGVVTITIIVNVLPAATGSLTNTATVSGDQNDPNQGNNTATVTTPVSGVANLVMTKTAMTLLPGPGDDLTYTLRADNAGPNDAVEVVIRDTIATNTTFKSLTDAQGWSCSRPQVGSGGTITCRTNSLAVGASATFTLVVTVDVNVQRDTMITNTAEISSTTFEADDSNNRSTVITRTGAPVVRVLPGAPLEIGPIQVLPQPSGDPSFNTFVVENTGNSPLFLTPLSLLRIAPDANKITQPADDRSLFDVRQMTSAGDQPLQYNSPNSIVVFPQQTLRFRVVFNPIIPMRAGKTSGLAANQVIPETMTSRLTLSPRGGNPFGIDLVGRVSTSARLVHPLDPRRTPLITLTQSGNTFKVESWVHDPNLDAYLVRYEFLNSNGGRIGSPIDVEISQAISQAGLARGQVFGIEQNFEGNTSNLGVSRVRVTIYDPNQSNDSAVSSPVGVVEPAIASVSAASYTEFGLPGETIVAGFGVNMSGTTQAATSAPLPTSLNGMSVRVRDGAGIERLAPLFFISPNQINYQLPAGVSPGSATVTVTNRDKIAAIGAVRVANTWPGLFSANGDGQGVAAAVVLRVKEDGTQSYEPVAQFDAAQNKHISVPINLGSSSDQVYLILFGTGLGYPSTLDTIKVGIGGVDVPLLYAGAQGGYAGLDQINVALPQSLSGLGEVAVQLTVDGHLSNGVQVNIGGNSAQTARILRGAKETTLMSPSNMSPRSVIVLPTVKLTHWY